MSRLIDADAYIAFIEDVSKRQKYKELLIKENLTVDDVLDSVIGSLRNDGLAEGDTPTIDAIIIPKNATNGDMFMAMFPNAEFDNAMPFTDGRWETINLDTENRTRATQLRTYADWWNAPYKKVEKQ